MDGDEARQSGSGRQLLGSLAAAALIVALAIWAVTAKLGPTGRAEREAAEESAEEAGEAREEAGEAREEAAGQAEETGEQSGRKRRRGGRN